MLFLIKQIASRFTSQTIGDTVGFDEAINQTFSTVIGIIMGLVAGFLICGIIIIIYKIKDKKSKFKPNTKMIEGMTSIEMNQDVETNHNKTQQNNILSVTTIGSGYNDEHNVIKVKTPNDLVENPNFIDTFDNTAISVSFSYHVLFFLLYKV